MTLGDLLVKVGVTGLPAFQTAMGGVSSSINKTFREADKAFSGFDKLGDKMADVGRSLSIGITAPLALASGAALKLATDFDAAMRGVASVIGGNVTEQQIKDLTDQTLALSKSMGIDAVDAANSLKLAIGTGIPQDNALEFLRVASIAAIGGVTETSTVVSALTTVLAAYGLEASDAKLVTDKMAEAVRFGSGNFGDLASAIGPAAAQAKSMGISLDDLLVVVGTLSVTSGSFSEAVTQAASAMTGLNQKTPELEAILKKMGFASGEAATKSLGLSGTLQGLSEHVGTSSAAFQELFGRKEAVAAALGVIGDKTQAVATNTQAMTKALEGAGASQRAFDINNESMSRKLEQAKNEIKGTAIELGIALLPSLSKVLEAMRPLIGMLQSAVDWFTSLSPTTQKVAIGFVAIGAALGPVLMAAGNLVSLFSGIASTLAALPGILSTVTSSFGTLSGVLGNISTAVIPMGGAGGIFAAAGIAVAGFGAAIAATWNQLDQLKDKYNLFLDQAKNQQIRDLLASGKTVDDLKALGFSLDEIRAAISKNTIETQKYKTSVDGFNISIEKSDKVISKHEEAERKAATQTAANTKAIEAQEKAEKARADTLSKLRENLAKTEELYKLGKATMTDVIKASADLNLELAEQDARYLKLHPTLGKVDTSMNSINEASWRTANVLAEQLNPSLMSSYTNFEKLNAKMYLNAGAWEDVMLAMDPLPAAIVDAGVSLDKLNGSMRSSKAPAYTLSDAIKEVGTKSPEEFGRLATAAEKVYDQLSESFPAASSIVKDAFRKMQEAKIAYERSLGNNDVADALEKQLGAHKEHGEKVETAWGRTAKQVSTIISDMGKNFASGIMKLFDNSENEKLNDQMAELRSSLADKTTAYQDHVTEVNAKLAEIPVAYDAAISDLETVTSTKLASIDDEYSDSIKGLKKKFQEVTESAAKQLDKQLKDLDEQLRDKKKNYDRSTQDANTSYKRDTENLRESLDDKEREYRQWVQEQQQNLLQLEGDNSASAERQRQDIRLAMQHRAEDMEDARADTQAALLREEEDLALSLKRKQDDYEADLAEIKAKQDEAQENYKKTLDDANTELETSLADRQAEYLKDKTAAIDTYEEAKAEIIKKYSDQTKALQDELGKALKEYDTYKLGVDEKLKALEDAHKGPLDRIGTMFTDIFKGAGDALLRFAGEEFMGFLMGKLDGLMEKLGGVNSIWGKIFGAGSSSIPSVPGTTPTVPTSTGGGGGGTSGGGIPMDPVGWAIQIAGIITEAVIAMRQEGTMNAIEQHTKVMAITLAGFAEPWGKVPEGQKTMIGYIAEMAGGIGAISEWNKTTLLPAISAIRSTLTDVIKPIIEDINKVLHVMMIPSGGGSGAGVTAEQAAALVAYSTFSNTQITTAFGEFKIKLDEVKNGIVGSLTTEFKLTRDQMAASFKSLVDEVNSLQNGLRDKLDDVFRPFGTFSDILNTIGGGGGGLGGLLGGAGSFMSSITTGLVSGITGLFKKGDSDRLDLIASATTYLAVAFGDLGLFNSLMGMSNNIAAFVKSQDGWVHDSWVELLGKVGQIDDLKWYADDTHRRIGDIRDSITSRLPELTAIKIALQTMPPPIVNVYVQGDLPNLVTTITTEITRGMALQGA